jgi:hypothetical protein
VDQSPLKMIEDDVTASLVGLVDHQGTAGHSYAAPAVAGDRGSFAHNLVDFADFIHIITQLHGQAPSLIDHAASRTAEIPARAWLVKSIEAFAIERDYLNRLCVAAGPIPSTPGQSAASTAIAQQSHAIQMLAQSERRGCALGTAVTLVLEWEAIRRILDIGAIRLGIEPPEQTLPSGQETMALISALPDPSLLSRAILFGATQLLAQHRGMWDLLKARMEARDPLR